jgi:hypothetical protein
MRILSLDLSKYKTVACDYEAETGRHQFFVGESLENPGLAQEGGMNEASIEGCWV